jgi:multicomponent Na+:H+ antiporter subunit G
MLDIIAATLILTGVALGLSAGIGLQRFPDVFARMHSATKPATLGLVLILAGASIRVSDRGDVVKLLLVIVLQFLTAPVGAHMVGRAAYNAGSDLSPATTCDDLARDRRAGWGAAPRPAAGEGDEDPGLPPP